jgi:serine/threonine protein phosphatase PrpC
MNGLLLGAASADRDSWRGGHSVARHLTTAGGLGLALVAAAAAGGGQEGDQNDEAASVALEACLAHIIASTDPIIPRLLSHAVQAANRAVLDSAQTNGARSTSAGLTVAAVGPDQRLYVAHVGSGAVYVCRSRRCTRLTIAHTFSTMVSQLGGLEAREGQGAGGGLVRALGFRERISVDIGFYVGTLNPEIATGRGLRGLPLAPGDSVIVSSDGLDLEAGDIIRAIRGKVGDFAARALADLAQPDGALAAGIIQVPSSMGRLSMARRALVWAALVLAFIALLIMAVVSFQPAESPRESRAPVALVAR